MGGRGSHPATTNAVRSYFHTKIERKTESKEIPSRLIPRLLVAFTQQLEILVTTLELLGNLKPSYLFNLGLGNIPIE